MNFDQYKKNGFRMKLHLKHLNLINGIMNFTTGCFFFWYWN